MTTTETTAKFHSEIVDLRSVEERTYLRQAFGDMSRSYDLGLPDAPSRLKTAEHGLLIAMLEDALHLVVKYADHRQSRLRRLSSEAESWIYARKTTFPWFDFETTCHHLDFDPSSIRDALVRMRSRPLFGRARRVSAHTRRVIQKPRVRQA